MYPCNRVPFSVRLTAWVLYSKEATNTNSLLDRFFDSEVESVLFLTFAQLGKTWFDFPKLGHRLD